MPVLRPLAWLFALLLLVVTAVALFALTFDANRYKPEIVTLVKEQTGRELAIGGDIGLSFYPNIALQLGQVKLGNAKGFTDDSFAEAHNARVEVQFLPLLQQQLKINEVHLQGLKLNLHRSKNGKTNWQDLLPDGSNQADAEAGEAMTKLLGGFVVTGVSVEDSQVRWQDDKQGKTVTLAPLNLKTGTFRPGKPVDIRLDTNLKQNQPALDMHLNITTTAQLADNKSDFSLSNLAWQVQMPDTLGATASGNLQGNLDSQQWAIPDLQAEIKLTGQGTLKLSGNLSVDQAKQLLKLREMQLQANLQGGGLPVDSLASSGNLSLNLGSGKGLLDLPQTQIKGLNQQLDGNLKVHDPLLPSRVVEGDFKAAKLSYPPFELQQASLGIHEENGQLKLTPAGTLFKGAYQGTINIDTLQNPPVLRTEHKVQKLRTEDLFFAMSDDRLVSGALDMTAKLDSVVGDAKLFKQNLNGVIDLELNEGTIRDANFAQKTQEVVKLFETGRINDRGVKEVAFTKLEGQWLVQQGVFHTDENVMTAPHFQIKGDGGVNIIDESLDFKLRISEKPQPGKPEGLFAPLHIFGAWKKLSYEVELDVLLKAMASSEIDKEKAKLKDKLEQRLQDELQKRLKGLP